MTNEEFNNNVMGLISELREAKEKSSIFSHELRGFGTKLETLGSIMKENPLKMEVRTDPPDLWIVDENSNTQYEINSVNLEGLYSKLKEYHRLDAKIREIEECLRGAGFGGVIDAS